MGNSKRCCKLGSHIVNIANQNAKPKTKFTSSAPTRFIVSEVATLLLAIAKQRYLRNFKFIKAVGDEKANFVSRFALWLADVDNITNGFAV